MNKAELINAIADHADLSKADAGRALDAVTDQIKRALKKGDDVSLVGFGTFVVRKRAARSGRNPRTGQTIKIKASKVPAFKAGKALKDALNCGSRCDRPGRSHTDCAADAHSVGRSFSGEGNPGRWADPASPAEAQPCSRDV
jgi:DNA-binding protein HU-beta